MARYTPIYRNESGTWITAFAPDAVTGRADDGVLAWTTRSTSTSTGSASCGARSSRRRWPGRLMRLLVGLLFARHLTRPIARPHPGSRGWPPGISSQALPVRSRDEIGRLTDAFNEMLDGPAPARLHPDTFGRYVSPEVAKTLLESPEGLRLGGEKREVTVLMSDLRGYTRFAEQGDPALGHGGAQRLPGADDRHRRRARRDHQRVHRRRHLRRVRRARSPTPTTRSGPPRRRWPCSAPWWRSTRAHAARGLPRFEMGIGVNTGEAVVGNIGSEQRAKYAVVAPPSTSPRGWRAPRWAARSS